MTVSPVAAAWVNIAASGLATITSTTAATAMPITNLQQEDTRRVWRGNGGAGVLESVFFDLLSAQSLDTIDLINTNLAASDTTRLRLSVADPTCVTNTYDSTATTGRVDPNYKDLVFLASPVSPPRYGRIDLTRAAGSPEAGYLMVGTRTQFAYNAAYGTSRTVVDPSVHKMTPGGQTKIRRRPKFFRWELPFDFVTEVQRWSVVEGIDMLNGVSDPVLFIINPASTNLGRDSIFGLVQESTPVITVRGEDPAGSGAVGSSKTYRIDQRL